MAQVTGKFVTTLPVVEGENNGKSWARGGFVMETLDAYPKYVALTIFGVDRLKLTQGLNAGDIIIAEYSPESRNVNERWYTDLKCIRITRTVNMEGRV